MKAHWVRVTRAVVDRWNCFLVSRRPTVRRLVFASMRLRKNRVRASGILSRHLLETLNLMARRFTFLMSLVKSIYFEVNTKPSPRVGPLPVIMLEFYT